MIALFQHSRRSYEHVYEYVPVQHVLEIGRHCSSMAGSRQRVSLQDVSFKLPLQSTDGGVGIYAYTSQQAGYYRYSLEDFLRTKIQQLIVAIGFLDRELYDFPLK